VDVVVDGHGCRRPLARVPAGAQSTWLSTCSTCPGPPVVEVADGDAGAVVAVPVVSGDAPDPSDGPGASDAPDGWDGPDGSDDPAAPDGFDGVEGPVGEAGGDRMVVGGLAPARG